MNFHLPSLPASLLSLYIGLRGKVNSEFNLEDPGINSTNEVGEFMWFL